jgi:hypothetical protein
MVWFCRRSGIGMTRHPSSLTAVISRTMNVSEKCGNLDMM